MIGNMSSGDSKLTVLLLGASAIYSMPMHEHRTGQVYAHAQQGIVLNEYHVHLIPASCTASNELADILLITVAQ